jgi:hypothetical protein
MLWDLPLLVSRLLWRTLVNVYRFLSVLFLRCWLLSQIDKKPIMNPKIGACDASLTEGIKFVFNNKTVLELLLLIW